MSKEAALLHTVTHHRNPYPYAHIGAVDEGLLAALDKALAEAEAWQRYDSFYRCWIAPAPCDVPDELTRELEGLVGIPLCASPRLTVQRMDPGDGATVHTDRPLLGYESARLIIHLSRGWKPSHGGLFSVHPDANATKTLRQHPPLRGSGVALALRPHAYHSVEPTHAARTTAVFHFAHPGNTPELAATLERVLGGASFAGLPASLHATMDVAEATLPEERTLYAGLVAVLVLSWGHGHSTALEAYRASLAPFDAAGPFLAARWLVHTWCTAFDLDAWARIAPVARQDPTCPADVRMLAFPARESRTRP